MKIALYRFLLSFPFMLLCGCIAPVPVDSVANPAIEGRITIKGRAAQAVEIWLDHEDYDACNKPKLKTTTDADGKFSFVAELRNWTWIGWANNHYVSICVLDTEGEKLQRNIRAVNAPEVIYLECDLAEKEHSTWCVETCSGSAQNRC